MPDFCMCNDECCPRRLECYRYTAIPARDNQAWFASSVRDGAACPYFMQNRRRVSARKQQTEKQS